MSVSDSFICFPYLVPVLPSHYSMWRMGAAIGRKPRARYNDGGRQRRLLGDLRNTMNETVTAEVQQLVQEGRAAAMAGHTVPPRTSFGRDTGIVPPRAVARMGPA